MFNGFSLVATKAAFPSPTFRRSIRVVTGGPDILHRQSKVLGNQALVFWGWGMQGVTKRSPVISQVER